MFHNPGKVLLALLMLGLSTATFIETSTPHRLWIASAYADIRNGPDVYESENADNATTTDEKIIHEKDPGFVLEAVAQCESGKRQFDSKGRLVRNFNYDDNGKVWSSDEGYYQINTEHEPFALKQGWVIQTYEGNRKMALYLYEKNGLKDWRSSRDCWIKLL
jgi:hypothetical protein